MMQERETSRQRFERDKTVIIGAPDSMAKIRERWCAVIFDGVPLGDHFTDEMYWDEAASLAIILVWCEADQEVAELRRLAERAGRNTADYEASLKNGRTVRIEVTQIVDQDAMNYLNRLNAVFAVLQLAWRKDLAVAAILKGRKVVFEFTSAYPDYELTDEVAHELLEVLRCYAADTGMRDRIAIHRDRFPLLAALDARVSVSVGNGDGSVRFRPPLDLSDTTRVLATLSRMLAKKRAKFPGYSDDGAFDVWLAIFARDEVSGFGYSAIQEVRVNQKLIKVTPFERVMIATAVCGLRLEDGSASYGSLTKPYEPVM